MERWRVIKGDRENMKKTNKLPNIIIQRRASLLHEIFDWPAGSMLLLMLGFSLLLEGRIVVLCKSDRPLTGGMLTRHLLSINMRSCLFQLLLPFKPFFGFLPSLSFLLLVDEGPTRLFHRNITLPGWLTLFLLRFDAWTRRLHDVVGHSTARFIMIELFTRLL